MHYATYDPETDSVRTIYREPRLLCVERLVDDWMFCDRAGVVDNAKAKMAVEIGRAVVEHCGFTSERAPDGALRLRLRTVIDADDACDRLARAVRAAAGERPYGTEPCRDFYD